MKKKKRAAPKGRMTEAHIRATVAEIEAFGRGEREVPLSWSHLEKFSGFSHVALWQKELIRAAFQRIKHETRRNATPTIRLPLAADERVARMQGVIDELRETVRAYDERWALYEYNVHRLGLDPNELRRPLDPVARGLPRQGRSGPR